MVAKLLAVPPWYSFQQFLMSRLHHLVFTMSLSNHCVWLTCTAPCLATSTAFTGVQLLKCSRAPESYDFQLCGFCTCPMCPVACQVFFRWPTRPLSLGRSRCKLTCCADTHSTCPAQHMCCNIPVTYFYGRRKKVDEQRVSKTNAYSAVFTCKLFIPS